MFKKRLETMICVLVLMVGLTSVGQAQLPSPVGWWKFDGDAIDSSGNGYG